MKERDLLFEPKWQREDKEPMKKFRGNEFIEARTKVQKRSLKIFAASPSC